MVAKGGSIWSNAIVTSAPLSLNSLTKYIKYVKSKKYRDWLKKQEQQYAEYLWNVYEGRSR